MAPTQLLVITVLAGLAAAALAALAKVTPIWPLSWHGQKPLGCVACMAGHASWLVLLLATLAGFVVPLPDRATAPITFFAQLTLAWLGSTGIAVLILGQSGLFMAPISLGDLGASTTSNTKEE